MANQLTPLKPTDRTGRYPKHAFQTRETPFSLQPICIAPVLPGETLRNLYFESRVVTDPIKNPIVGWKKEYYFYYIPISILMVDAIRDMFIDPLNTDLSATLGIGAHDADMYTAKGGVDYLKRCATVVAREHFWDETDAPAYTAGGVPLVQVRERFWLDSLTDEDTSVLATDPGATGDTPTTPEQLQQLMDVYDQLNAFGVSQMTFEDFLRSYGISIPEVVTEKKPELLARFADFQYPSNTVDPATGGVASAVSWVFKNGKRDPKFFKEPGFVVGFSITRPKMYFGGLAGNLAGHLTRAWDWIPNYLNEHSAIPMPETSLKKFSAATGPLGDRVDAYEDGYWIEMRDLFLHGDQFQNVRPFGSSYPSTGTHNAGEFNILDMPWMNNIDNNTELTAKYVYEPRNKAFFKDDAACYIRQDGYVTLQVQGKVGQGIRGPITAANLAANLTTD